MQGQSGGASQFNRYIAQYLATDHAAWTDTLALVNHINILEKDKGRKNDAEFLHLLFTKTHKVFLRNYDAYGSFAALLHDGRYNCLTGTALYALLLNRFGYNYKIIETNYHIFLIVAGSSGPILYEATDPRGGFLTNQKAIDARIRHYRENKLTADNSRTKNQYTFRYNLFNAVDLNQLTGLLLYNKAVEAFNQNKIKECVWYLDETEKYYTSERITEFSSLIAYVITDAKVVSNNSDVHLKELKHQRQRTAF